MISKQLGQGAALALALSCATIANAQQQQTLRITSWGGAFQEAQQRIFFKPFEQETGIKIVEDTWQGNIGQVRAMVESKKITSDLFDGNPNDVITACDEGIAEPLDKSFIKDPNDFFEGAITECGLGTDIWANIWAFDGDRVSKEKGPKTIADVFDVQKFPGRRGLPRRIYGIAEQALLADGVPVQDIYKVLGTPQGLDRVFKKLSSIKKDIVWWSSNPQALQLLADNEVQYVALPSSHWYAATTRQNSPRNFIPMFDGQIFSYDMWMMPRGTPNKVNAQKFLEFISRPEKMIEFAAASSYAPSRKSATDMMKPEVKEKMAIANATNPIRIDRIWWADRMDSYTKRFEAWLQE
ncbi:extracellular solute-binding protein [Sinorhizobium meliloti]|uniref:extracellular solute-binding protein n=1 Tax=Rhizobium meliloti TaxID=382 RepID=UPI003D64CB39